MSKEDRKTVVITGVSRGLGRAMVEKFIAAGHTVAGCSRSEKTVLVMATEHAPPHRFDAVDVADDNRVKAWAGDVLSHFGPPDLLLNNAALINANAPLWEVPADEFSQVIDVNIKGVANVCRHFLPAMIERGAGVVVNFSSTWGRSTSPEVAPYCATKWAMEGLTRALAGELPSGLAAVPLNPGVINTEMLQSCLGSSANGYPDADQWSETAVPFLLSLNASHNGQPLTVPIERSNAATT